MAGAANDHVVINLTIQSTGLARAGYGIPLILSHRAAFGPRIKYYSTIGALGADFASTSPEYRAATVIFAQQPHPRFVAVGRAGGTVTQRYDIGISAPVVGGVYAISAKGQGVTDTTVSYTALANLDFVPGDVTTGTDTIAETGHGMLTGAGPFRLSNSGGGLPAGTAVDTNYWIIAASADTYKLASSKANALAATAVDLTTAGTGTHTLLRANNDTIIAQLVQGLSAVAGANFATVQTVGAAETDTLRATGNAVNNWFSLEISDPDAMSNVQSHVAPVDVTLATDLAAIRKADQGWYTLHTLYNSKGYVTDVETWAEANGVTYVWDTCDTACVTVDVGSGTDVGAVSLASGYARSMGCYHPSPADFLAPGIMGRWLVTDPGKATAKYKTLALVRPTVLTDQHKQNLRGLPGTPGGRRMNAYEQVLADRPFFWEAFVFSTVYKFIDITRNADWLRDNVQLEILGVFVGSDIVPETPQGVSKIVAAVRRIKAVAIDQGVLRDGAVVQAPVFDDISSTDLANRNLPGLVLSGAFAGAIHTVIPVDITLTF